MIKKLFRNSLFVLSALLGTSQVQGQTTVATAYTLPNPNPTHTIITPTVSPGTKIYGTFTLYNANPYPIVITDVGSLHISNVAIMTGFPPVQTGTISSNGSPYELWSTSTWLTGLPNITTGTGWVPEKTATFSGGSGFGVQPIFGNMQILVQAGDTRRFAVVLDDTAIFRGDAVSFTPRPAGPGIFLNGGVYLTTVDTNQYVAVFPNGARINNTKEILGWEGSVKFFAIQPPVITVNPKPACLGDSVVLTATSGAFFQNPVYTWYDNNGIPVPGVIGNRFVIYNLDASKKGFYCATVTGSNTTFVTDKGCAEVILNTPPPPQVEGKVDFCLNDPFVPVTLVGPGAGSAKWYYSATGGSPIPFTPTFNTTTAHRDTFYVSQTLQGCESPRTMVIYRAAPKPGSPIVTTPTFYCENSTSVPITANGQNLKWYYEPSGGLPSTLPPTPNTTKRDTFDYFVSQTVDGCEGPRAPLKVVVTFRPNGLILASRDQLCQNDTITLAYYGSAFPEAAYNWTFPDGTNIEGGDPQGPLVISLDSPGKREIFLQVGSTGCYSDKYSHTIQVDPLPTAVIEARPNICQGQTELVSVSFFTPTVDSFIWNWAGGRTTHYSTDQGPYGVIWDTPGAKLFSVRLVDELCSATIYDSTFVHAKPDASFKIDGYSADKQFCSGDSLLLTANTILAGANYSWSPNRFFDTYSNVPTAYARIDYKGFVKLSVTDEFSCNNSDSILVNTKPCCEVIFPTAFSPNNDNRNDYFRPIPQVAGQQRTIEIGTMKVVNRWGQTVYESLNERRGWDGNMNGKPQDVGTYMYFISFKCDGKTIEQKGDVVLVR